MPDESQAPLPDVGQVLLPLLERVDRDDRPLLIAIAERLAAQRYRRWADEASLQAQRPQLLACADREEEIARRIEALRPDAGVVQQDLMAKNPDLLEINRSLFADRPLSQQLLIQARGERLGAATWRSLARQAEDPKSAEVLLGCAELEEQSAEVLESIFEG